MGCLQTVIKEVGNQKIKYPVVSTKSFLSLSQYLALSKTTIYWLAPRLYSQMIKSEDAISYIVETIMFADWRHLPDNKLSLDEYRDYCVKCAIKTMLKRSQSKKNQRYSLLDFEPQSKKTVLDEVVAKAEAKKQANFLLDNSGLTPRERKYVYDSYINQMEVADIKEKYKVSRQDVEKGISLGLDKLARCARGIH